MRKFLLALALPSFVLVLSFTACSSGPSARLVEWRDQDLTLCCLKKECSDKDWVMAAKLYCSGAVSMVGGKIIEGIGGYKSVEKGDKVSLTPVMAQQSCRTFKCEGNILPPR